MTSDSRRRAVRVRRQMRRGAYLLPSLFTMGNIMLGFFGIVRAIGGDFKIAAVAIFAAGFLDGIDGRVARLTGTESEFGKEFDSLADAIAFGCSPALIAYLWALRPLDRLGWLIALYFLLCTVIRLARFNVQTKTTDSRYFVGLPSPAAAAVIVGLIYIAHDRTALEAGLNPEWLQQAMPFMVVLIGSLMVSTFRYPSLKKVDLRRRLSYRGALVMATVVLVLVYYPEAFLPGLAFLFASLGPLGWLVGRLRRRPTEAPETGDASDLDPLESS